MKKYNEVEPLSLKGIDTKIPDLNEFLSLDGGIQLGYVIFLTGTSGAGKTTLCKLLQRNIDQKTALLEKETTAELLAKQLQNIDTSKNDNCYIDDKMTVEEFLNYATQNNIKLVIIDSLQKCCNSDFPNLGEREASLKIYNMLTKWTEDQKSTIILVGTSNKDGSFEGSNSIKHMASAHIEAIYNSKENVRFLFSTKNRMGGKVGSQLFYRFVNTDEVMEFSYENFPSSPQDLNICILNTVKHYLLPFKKTDKALYKLYCKRIQGLADRGLSDDEITMKIVALAQEMVGKNMEIKKIA